MENKINIANLLKDCPSGMELDSPLFDDVHFDSIDEVYDIIKCYIQDSHHKIDISFNKYGCYSNISKSKCVIFPKGKTTWEGFVPPYHFKDGDIVATNNGSWIAIIKEIGKIDRVTPTYCVLKSSGEFEAYFDREERWAFNRLATEEEKQKLFDAIKANGYKWNAETKTLEKLPKFKVGDRVKKKDSNEEVGLITDIADNHYIVETKYGMEVTISVYIQDDYVLIPNKFDITALNPFDKVLVRDKDTDTWEAHLFSRYYKNSDRPYICIGVEGINEFNQCIPYDSNKELLGTTDNCDKFYKTWE